MLLNLSFTKNLKIPRIELAVSWIDLNGDISINAPGFLFAAKCAAGPEPIDLPQIIMSFSSIPISPMK